jgi:hypothetical protein
MENLSKKLTKTKKNPEAAAESTPMADSRANLEGIRDKRHYRTYVCLPNVVNQKTEKKLQKNWG